MITNMMNSFSDDLKIIMLEKNPNHRAWLRGFIDGLRGRGSFSNGPQTPIYLEGAAAALRLVAEAKR